MISSTFVRPISAAGLVQVPGQVIGGVERVERDHRAARQGRGVVGDRVLGQVRREQRQDVALPEAADPERA
jgi:hypothetical protein